MIHDITPPITPKIAVWPGDTPLSREVLCNITTGANITLSTLRATVHLGAHADGPNHYGEPAPGIGERSLDFYIGPCHLVDARTEEGRRVGWDDVQWPADLRHPRILIRTGTFPDPESFNTDFAALEPALIDALALRGVRTIGIDTPSVDLFDSKDLPAHKAFLRHDMAILEGLALRGVPAGEYELIALPLKLMGFDASPVRAILRGWQTPTVHARLTNCTPQPGRADITVMPHSPKLMRDQAAVLETDHMIPIVVGAHPKAEHTDRPIAYRLRERMNLWLANHAQDMPDPLTPIVVTDVWYLNDAALRERPSISIGGPNVNAFTAYLADKLPSAFTIDGVLTVQMDLAMSDVLATCWGTSSPETLRAMDAFCERYLDQFMDAAVNEV